MDRQTDRHHEANTRISYANTLNEEEYAVLQQCESGERNGVEIWAMKYVVYDVTPCSQT